MTTPSPFALQKFLAHAIAAGCTHAVVEVSSHALQQYRVWGIPFAIVLITNLTPDHLEYHATSNEYIHIHEMLPSKATRTILINAQDGHSEFFKQDSRTHLFSQHDPETQDISSLPQWWTRLQLPNLTAARAAARALGRREKDIAQSLRSLTAPPGRFEDIDEGQNFRVIVDYAHSPESLSFFFEAIRPLIANNLIVVFGACGDRDKTTRAPMGSILEHYADTLILTTDDPYSEDPKDIADQVQAGITKKTKMLLTVLDRKEAIQKGLEMAQKNDCVCILGKGAEQFQVFKNNKIPWDDRTIARSSIRART